MKISIIVATRDSADSLALTLTSLACQTCRAADYEILIVDNGSTDHTADVVVQARAAYPSHTLRYVIEPIPGSTAARHRGVLEAHGELIVFVDHDIDADPGWLQAILDTFADPDVELVGGPSLPRYEVEPPDWLKAFWSHRPGGYHSCGYLTLVDLGDKAFEMENPNYIWALNFSMRKQTFKMLGGLHAGNMPWELRPFMGDEESAVTRKAKALGMKAIYEPRALVYHRIPASRLTVEYFERRAFMAGISDSYKDVRANGGLLLTMTAGKNRNWRAPLRRAKHLAKYMLQSLHLVAADPYAAIKNRVQVAYQAGYKYHQEEVRKDPELLKWVLRQDYWDATVPSN